MQVAPPTLGTGPAGSCFLLGVLCLLEWLGVFPRFSGAMMTIQFLVIHSSAFIFSLPFWQIREGAKPVIFKILLVLYAAFAFKADGLLGIVEFAGLTYATYYGYIFTRTSQAERMPLLLRWGVAFFLFTAATGIAGAPSDADTWAGNRRLALAGTLYFFAAGLLELGGFYGDWWKNSFRLWAAEKPELRAGLPPWLLKEIYGAGPDTGGTTGGEA